MPALSAHAKKPVVMKNHFKAVLLANPLLQLLDFFASEFDVVTAPDANHVIVMAPSAGALVKFFFAAADGFLDDTTFKEKRDGPVNGIPRNAQVFMAKMFVKAVRVKMGLQVTHFLKNGLPFVGVFELILLQQTLEFFGHFLGNRHGFGSFLIRINS